MAETATPTALRYTTTPPTRAIDSLWLLALLPLVPFLVLEWHWFYALYIVGPLISFVQVDRHRIRTVDVEPDGTLVLRSRNEERTVAPRQTAELTWALGTRNVRIGPGGNRAGTMLLDATGRAAMAERIRRDGYAKVPDPRWFEEHLEPAGRSTIVRLVAAASLALTAVTAGITTWQYVDDTVTELDVERVVATETERQVRTFDTETDEFPPTIPPPAFDVSYTYDEPYSAVVTAEDGFTMVDGNLVLWVPAADPASPTAAHHGFGRTVAARLFGLLGLFVITGALARSATLVFRARETAVPRIPDRVLKG